MKHKINKYLYDILNSINYIESFLGENRNFYDYENNHMLKRAVEREFEIIGEALNRILKINPNIIISNSRNIIGLRNHIIHAYDNIVDEIIWGIINKNLPQLKIEVKKLIDTNDSES